MGLVTGSGLKEVTEKAGKEMLAVMIPTSPTPFTGFVIMIPKEDAIDLDITMEEAIRFCMSAGVISPRIRTDGINGRNRKKILIGQ